MDFEHGAEVALDLAAMLALDEQGDGNVLQLYLVGRRAGFARPLIDLGWRYLLIGLERALNLEHL